MKGIKYYIEHIFIFFIFIFLMIFFNSITVQAKTFPRYSSETPSIKEISELCFQTSGPNLPLIYGDFYTSRFGAFSDEQVFIYVPPTLDQDITMEIFDPEVFNRRDTLFKNVFLNDSVRSVDTTTYTLTAPDGTTIVEKITYSSSRVTDSRWVVFITFNKETFGAGRYILSTKTSGKSDNAWALKVTTAETNPVDPIRLSSNQVTYLCNPGKSEFEHTWYVFVPPDAICVQFTNFDINGNGLIKYLEPGKSEWQTGTTSLDGTWNNCEGCESRPNYEQGDIFHNPASGWWTIQLSNVRVINQFTIEAHYGTEGAPCYTNQLSLFDSKD